MSTNKIQQATVGFSGNFDVLAAGPMDAKTRAAATVEDLIKEETWASRDNNCYIYNGLMAILDDGSVYVLTDASKYQEQASWKKVGSDFDGSAYVLKTGDTMTGSLTISKGESLSFSYDKNKTSVQIQGKGQSSIWNNYYDKNDPATGNTSKASNNPFFVLNPTKSIITAHDYLGDPRIEINGGLSSFTMGRHCSVEYYNENAAPNKFLKEIQYNQNNFIFGDGKLDIYPVQSDGKFQGYEDESRGKFYYTQIDIRSDKGVYESFKQSDNSQVSFNEHFQNLFRNIYTYTNNGGYIELAHINDQKEHSPRTVKVDFVKLQINKQYWTGDSWGDVGQFEEFNPEKSYTYDPDHSENPYDYFVFRLECYFNYEMYEQQGGELTDLVQQGVYIIAPNSIVCKSGFGNDFLMGKSGRLKEAEQTFSQGFLNVGDTVVNSHIEGHSNVAKNVSNSHIEGYANNAATGSQIHIEGSRNYGTGESSHTEGEYCSVLGKGAHAEGSWTGAFGDYSHAEGIGYISEKSNWEDDEHYTSVMKPSRQCLYNTHNQNTSVIADDTGLLNIREVTGVAYGHGSHVEGFECITGSINMEGETPKVITDDAYSGFAAHAEGERTVACGRGSHTGGYDCRTYAPYSMAFGNGCRVKLENYCSAAFGQGSIASSGVVGQFVVGKYNNTSTNGMQFIVGGGESDTSRKNLFTVNTSGTATVAADPVNDMDVVTKRYVDSLSSNCITLDYNSITDPIEKELVAQKDLEQVLSSFFNGRSGVHTDQQFECYKNISNKDIISQLNLILTGIVKRVTLKVYDGDLDNYSFVPTTIIFPTDAQFNNGGRDENASCLIAGWGIGGTDGVITSSSTQHGTRSALVGNYNTIYDSQQGTNVSTYGGLNPILYCIYVKRTVTENVNTGGYDYSDYIIYKGTITSEDERVGIWGGT